MKRRVGQSLASLAVTAITIGMTAPACSSGDDCTNDDCVTLAPGLGGPDDPRAPTCDPSVEVVEDDCGVFVSSSAGDDGSPGTRLAPVKTLAEAVKRAREPGAPGAIYACAEAFTEAVELPAGLTVYGGLDCKTDWRWIGLAEKTAIVGPPDVIALRLTAGEGVTRLQDVSATAPDATVPGGSSIAAIAINATVDLVRCELRAGTGADGAAGDPAPVPVLPNGNLARAMDGVDGNDGRDACATLITNPGGAMVERACDTGEVSRGGKGGNGSINSATNGEQGYPEVEWYGYGGEVWPFPDYGECTWLAGNGLRGADGVPGGGATGLGTLSMTEGWVGVRGGDGKHGKIGSGGGGAGGAIGDGSLCAGASGGGGGSGGCGGKPGYGGESGGSSITLISLAATVSLTDCALVSGDGGDGGDGGKGEPGGWPGWGGLGGEGTSVVPGPGLLSRACHGGRGGAGGDGGQGGGGLGGHTLPIAYRGAPVTKIGDVLLQPGTPGHGGQSAQFNSGATGVHAYELEFP